MTDDARRDTSHRAAVPVTDRVRAALASHYRIERELGAGGMATVFLATDLKHDREVAVKVLRADLAAVLGVERFLGEVKIAARLDHPHILTLIDSGESDGLLYYVMPFVRGESLRARLDRETQLGIDEALSITRQVASALDYAHARGVVHRDIKPENILLHEGVAVLADFGIALAVREAGGNRLTETGLSLGTPRYMSPEQATGDRALDARSDVYSLAAVLYEMLGGESPVTGATAQAMIAKLLTEKPSSLRVVRDTVSVELDAAVQRGLAKVPADRFRSAGELARAADLAARAPATGAGVAGRPGRFRPGMIAVAAAVLLLGAVGAYLALAPRDSRRPFDGAVLATITTSGRAYQAVPSPDGSQLAYMEEICDRGICRADLMIREMSGEGVAAIVAEPNMASLPYSWSPDGRWVLFANFNLTTNVYEGAYMVSQRGGVPRRVSSAAASFVANDTLVTATESGGVYWLRRLVALSGTATDSVQLPVAGARRVEVSASPSGRWLLASVFSSNPTAFPQVVMMSRAGQPTDTIPVSPRGAGLPKWDASARDALLMDLPVAAAGAPGGAAARVVVRRPIDRRGRLAPAETLATHDPSARFASISSDGTQLFFDVEQSGAATSWTATRPNTQRSFILGRELPSGADIAAMPLSPRGGWILIIRQVGSGGNLFRIEAEPFAGGDRKVLEPAVPYRDIAFSPRDDSVSIATGDGTGRIVLTNYPLPAGAPVRRSPYQGSVEDLEWLSDGRLVSPQPGGRSILDFGREGETKSFPFPDSLGSILSAARSPTAPELALLSVVQGSSGRALFLTRMDMTTGKVTLITRLPVLFLEAGRVWWSNDGFLRFLLPNTLERTVTLVRVPVSGGKIEPERPLTFAPNATVDFLSHDGLRAIVSSQSFTSNVAVLRAPARQR